MSKDTPGDAQHTDPVRPDGPGLTGTSNEGLPSVAGLTGDQRPVEQTNLRDDAAAAPTPEQTAAGAPSSEALASHGSGPGADATAPVQVGERRGMFGARDGGDTSGYGGLRRLVLMPGASERPYGGWYDEVVDLVLAESGAGTLARVVVDRGELTLHVEREHLRQVMQALRDTPELRFEMCMSVSGVHYPEQTGRELHAVYQLLSITHGGRRLRVECAVPDADPHLPSVVATYPAADWHEREAWDMFGLIFDGHPALTRILMPDDWPGHPQRKDYPLGGIPVEYKGGTVPPPDERRSYS